MSLQPFDLFNATSQQILYPVLNPITAIIPETTQSFQLPTKLDINQLAEKYSTTYPSETLNFDKYKVTTDFEDFLDVFSQGIQNKPSEGSYTLSFTPETTTELKIKDIDQLAENYSKALVLSKPYKYEYEQKPELPEQSFSLSLSRPINASLVLLNSPNVNLMNPSRVLQSYIEYFFGSLRNFQRLMVNSQSGFLVPVKSSSLLNPFRLFTSNTNQLKLTNETILSIENITTLVPTNLLVENVTQSFQTYLDITGSNSNYSPRPRPSPTFTPVPTYVAPFQLYNGYFNKPTPTQLPQPSYSYSSSPTYSPTPTAKARPSATPKPFKPLVITDGYFNYKPIDYSAFFGMNQNLIGAPLDTIIPPIGETAKLIEDGFDNLGNGVKGISDALVVYSSQAGIPENYSFYGIPLLFISILLLSAFFRMYKSLKHRFYNEDNIVFICHSKGISKAKINPLWKFKNLKESIFIWNNEDGIQINLNKEKIKTKKVNENQFVADFLKIQIIRGNNKMKNKKFIVFSIENNKLVYFHLENYVNLQ
jgi:hypothetical protein